MFNKGSAKPASQLTLVTSVEGDSAVVRCTGKLIAGGTAGLQSEVRGLIPGHKRIVLDLANLNYMDSSGLGSIIGLHTSAKTAGTRLELINMSERVISLFRMTNVLSLFEMPGA